jgi:hypothetical protein
VYKRVHFQFPELHFLARVRPWPAEASLQCSGALPMQRYRRSPRGLVSGCRAAC